MNQRSYSSMIRHTEHALDGTESHWLTWTFKLCPDGSQTYRIDLSTAALHVSSPHQRRNIGPARSRWLHLTYLSMDNARSDDCVG